MPEGVVAQHGHVRDAWDQSERRRRPAAVLLGAVLGRRHDVLALRHRVDLRDHDAGAAVERVANGRVVVAGDPDREFNGSPIDSVSQSFGGTYRTNGMVLPLDMNIVSWTIYQALSKTP